jgi:TonB family protein
MTNPSQDDIHSNLDSPDKGPAPRPAESISPALTFVLGFGGGIAVGILVFLTGSSLNLQRKAQAGEPAPMAGPLSASPAGAEEVPGPHPKVEGAPGQENASHRPATPAQEVAGTAPKGQTDEASGTRPGSPAAAEPPEQRPLRVLNAVTPEYPRMAKTLRIQGPVEVVVKVDPSGRPEAETALSGNRMLRMAAEDAASRWTFVPRRSHGQNVAGNFTIHFNFRIVHGGEDISTLA